MTEQWWGIVFTRDFEPGEHWRDHLPAAKAGEQYDPRKHRAPDDDPDRKQRWHKGDLYSVGTVVGDDLPDHLKKVAIPPPEERTSKTWDRDTETFIDKPQIEPES